MRVQVASDLHLEFLERQFPGERLIAPAHQVDVLVLAGDIGLASSAVDLFGDWPVPVLYVAGNHEGYHECWEDMQEEIRDRARNTSVRFLERDSADFGGVRFLGCTLWTDYCLLGTHLQRQALENAQRSLRDHRVIRTRSGERFLPEDALRDHKRSSAWLCEELCRPYDGKTIVVTHHGPHPLSVHPRYGDDNVTNAAFVSDLTELVRRADYWFHGHVHDNFDYRVGNCRVVANPRGYPRNRHSVTSVKALEFENPRFQYACVIDTAVQ
jgi:Icc-related predicted phosphoesterase